MEIDQDSGKFFYGLNDTMNALEMGAIKILIIWEDLDMNRFVLKNSKTNGIVIKILNKEEEADKQNFEDLTNSADLEIQERMTLVEWLLDEYKKFGCSLEIVTDKSHEGSQFCEGFGGIGGILRYQLDVGLLDEDYSE
ncbi:hypothetical protein JCGZ_22750 [Jatropha curcas]|uniref:eRF1 domain-containing protein n=1 Tax=Jatropha curcas TaxID=180498 RepID=A0A067L7M2_JATCU|nr:hypothetical protein JCGZ_22750 [Jatropha curcas]